MNEVKIFNHPSFGAIRTAGTPDEPMFCLNDVARALDISNPRHLLTRLNPKGVATNDTPTAGGLQPMTYINESNLYKCIFQSRKEEAEVFQEWVTSEVLPSIRKQGAYLTPAKIEEVLSDPDTIIKLATTLKREQAKCKELEATIEEQAPKVLFADAVETSRKSILIGELAKILKQNGYNIGQNRLFEQLRGEGYLCKRGEQYNQPTQYSMELELFEIKKGTVLNPDGSTRVTTTTKVTPKGQRYFITKYLQGNTPVLDLWS